jgi:hypothetical protein
MARPTGVFHASAVRLGRKTLKGLVAHWSPLKDEWANLINAKPKYVASRTLHGSLEWKAALLEGDELGRTSLTGRGTALAATPGVRGFRFRRDALFRYAPIY